MSKKTLEELVFHDDFMFAAVMMDAENCRCFLERVLEIRIERVEISTEHGFFFNPECKSIPVFRRSTRKFPSFSSCHFFISFPASRFFLYLQQIFNALLGLFLLKKFF